MCTQYDLHPPADIVFYITDVALPPLIFGLGIAGNLLLMLVLNLREMRRESAVYVYLAATAGVDILALLCTVPPFVRDVELLPVPVAHSYPAAVAIWVRRAIDPMLRHAAAWFAALIIVVRFASVDITADGSDTPRVPDSPSRWTRISSARIIAFVAVIGCSLLDFTRFFDAAVVPLVGHCFDPEWLLWSVNRTRFASVRPLYVEIQPAVSALAGGALPLAVAALFGAILWLSTTACCRRCCSCCCRHRAVRSSPSVAVRRSACLRTPADYVEREDQLTSTVIAIAVAAVFLEGPRVVLDVIEALRLVDATGSDVIGSLVTDRLGTTTTLAYAMRYVGLVTRCLSLVRCAINFVLIAVLDYDFRKTLRRAFCCCCATADDVYYEPVVCCCRRSSTTAEKVASSKCDVVDNGQRGVNRKDCKIVTLSSSSSSTSSSSRKRDNRATAEHALQPLPAVLDDVKHGIHGNASTDVGFYCDVDDDRAMWV